MLFSTVVVLLILVSMADYEDLFWTLRQAPSTVSFFSYIKHSNSFNNYNNNKKFSKHYVKIIRPYHPLISSCTLTSAPTITSMTTNSTNTPTTLDTFMVATNTSVEMINRQRFQPLCKRSTIQSLSFSTSPVHLHL